VHGQAEGGRTPGYHVHRDTAFLEERRVSLNDLFYSTHDAGRSVMDQ
jgi:hypothetical protein